MIQITESPRDAMQGIIEYIPAEKKAKFINSLLKVGFDVLDFGSFVSAKAVPQMADTAEVLKLLDLTSTKTKLLAIVANKQGAETAAGFNEIAFLGYPYAMSPTFLRRNINKTSEEALALVDTIQEICIKTNKTQVVYLSMVFGNPYGDNWSKELVYNEVEKLSSKGINFISLSDTVGISEPSIIAELFSILPKKYPQINFSFHLHTTPEMYFPRLEAAIKAGCTNFDTVIGGLGGCPMTGNELVANLQTWHLIQYLESNNLPHTINTQALQMAAEIGLEVIPAEYKK
ncbi:MAG TPA: hydroxymethylglutaryl-CoA lyase [Bacteroidales bacterium]|nr:hydroxymethylglutaryl-CoA lyase [Bacteroidales bacterium]